MAYCTVTDLQNAGITPAQLVQLTDDNADGVADTTVLTEAIAEADGIIDSYLAARYTVPLAATVPATIRGASVALAARKLYQRRGLTNEAREAAAKAAMDFLLALSKGTATLGVANPPAAINEGGPESTRTEDDRIFTLGRASDGSRGSLDGF